MKLASLFRLRTLRKSHRYLGLVVGIQLLFWTVSGLYFVWNPIIKVRGEHLASAPRTLADVVADYEALVAPSAAVAAVAAVDADAVIDSLSMRPLLEQPVYEIHYRVADTEHVATIDARSGKLRDEITADEARTIAEADFTGEGSVRAVERVESSAPDGEYREKPLPAWRVVFDHPSNARIYVAAETGRITARRNDTWRVFDFLWMFHILDFEARGDFNHWLLRIMSVLGLVTVLSGFALFVATSEPMKQRRANKALRQIG